MVQTIGIYQCGHCGTLYGNETIAKNCCDGQEEFTYMCRRCGSIYSTDKAAMLCCTDRKKLRHRCEMECHSTNDYCKRRNTHVVIGENSWVFFFCTQHKNYYIDQNRDKNVSVVD